MVFSTTQGAFAEAGRKGVVEDVEIQQVVECGIRQIENHQKLGHRTAFSAKLILVET